MVVSFKELWMEHLYPTNTLQYIILAIIIVVLSLFVYYNMFANVLLFLLTFLAGYTLATILDYSYKYYKENPNGVK